MNFKIINSEHFIVSVSPDQVPAGMRGHVLLFYIPKRDAIAISEDCQIFKSLTELTEVYLSLDDKGRKRVMDEISDKNELRDILEVEKALNKIIRIRRKLYRKAVLHYDKD